MRCPQCEGKKVTLRLKELPSEKLDYIDPLGRRNRLRLEGELIEAECGACQGTGEVTELTYCQLTACKGPQESMSSRQLRLAKIGQVNKRLHQQ